MPKISLFRAFSAQGVLIAAGLAWNSKRPGSGPVDDLRVIEHCQVNILWVAGWWHTPFAYYRMSVPQGRQQQLATSMCMAAAA
jgi:hypothetical protein